MSRTQPRSTPVDLRPGDEFKTPLGPIEIWDKRGEGLDAEFQIHDPETHEVSWLDFDLLVRITSANCYNYRRNA